MLAESGAPPILGRASDTCVRYVRCQTGQAVDDILVGYSDGSHDFVQAKRSLSLEESADSDLATALDQFVRQYTGNAGDASGRPWDQALDVARDRLVLAVGPSSSKPIREDLRAVLDRARALVSGQPLHDAAVNAAERHALTVATSHLRRSWTLVAGTAPTDAELHAVMRHLYVMELDVEGHGANAREAQLLLRSSVVRDPSLDAAAWATICTTAAQLAQDRSGIDRVGLESVLRNAGIKLRGVRSYEADIARLASVTDSTLLSLERFASFESGGRMVRLPREVSAAITEASANQSFAIVGDPGGGKSESLFQAASTLRDDGVAAVVLQAVEIAARNFGELRQHLGLAHEFVDVLANWREAERGVLFVDALDAARDDSAARMLRELIALVLRKLPHWRVVASIRSFDLRQGTQLQDVFRGTVENLPLTFRRDEFAASRHVYVPHLTDDEIAAIADLAPNLRALILSADGALRDLLRVPFNIQLLARLVDDGVALSALQPLRTQGELLDLFWQRRVRRDALGDARETLLGAILEQMVAKRQLRADRVQLHLDSAGSQILNDVLSEHVLAEADSHQGRFVTFAHHVLFDYAAARLVLPSDPSELATYLASDAALIFVLRPSLVLAFHERWRRSRSEFWSTALLLLQEDRIARVGQVIGPVTAVDLAADASDWDDLFAALRDPRPEQARAAATALQLVVGSLLAAGQRPIVGPDSGPWAALAERMGEQLRPELTGPLRALLFALTEKLAGATDAEQQQIGRAARLLLEYAERELPASRNLIVAGLTLVARTVSTDAGASVALLRLCLEHERVQRVGFEELPTLAREAEALIAADPAFGADLYATTFSFVDESKDSTQIGGSAILPLTSNRTQDYRSAFYSLAEAFSGFFAHSPLHATRALVRAIDGYVLWRHPPASGTVVEDVFAVADFSVRLRTDYSAIWDKSPRGDAEGLLSDFERGLLALADAGATDTLDDVIRIVFAENRMAAVWRRLLRAGVLRPETIGVRLAPLLQRPVFLCYDTWRLAAELLRVIYPHLDAATITLLEETVVNLADDADNETREGHERVRDEIAKHLPREHMQTETLRSLQDRLKPPASESQPPPAQPKEPFLDDDDVEVGWLNDDEALAFRGIDVTEPSNARLRSLTAAVEHFSKEYANAEPTTEAVARAVPQIEALQAAVATAAAEGAHAEIIEEGRLASIEACSVIPKCQSLAADDPAVQLARTVLLGAATSANPVFDEQFEANWNTHASGWSSADRIEAAQGLLYLARRAETCDSAVLDAIENLAGDPVASVRYQIVRGLTLLYNTAPERMWSLLQSRIAQEQRGGVAVGIMGCLNDVKRADEQRVATLIISLVERLQATDAHEVVKLGVKILAVLAIWPAIESAQEFIDDVIANTASDPKRAGAILQVIREALTYGAIDDAKASGVRTRVTRFVKSLLERAIEEYRANIQRRDFTSASEQEIAHARAVVGIIDGIAHEVYFASGAHDLEQGERPRVDEAQRRRLYVEVAPILDLLATTGLPPATHALLETLEAMIPFEPEEVFFRIEQILRIAHDAGYSNESQGVSLVVRIVERYLADYRHLFQANAKMRAALSDILSLFIEAGWPQALRLASRLEEIFR